MTQRQIARLACKLLAIYTIIDSLKYVYYAGYMLTSVFAMARYGSSVIDWPQLLFMMLGLAMPVAQVVVGIWLWKRAGVVAAWITGHNLQDQENEPDVVPVPANLQAVHTVALSIMGVWVLIDAVPQAISFLTSLALRHQASSGFLAETVSVGAASSLTSVVVKLIIGFWLIFGSPGVVRMLKGFAYVGLDQSERPGGGARPPDAGA